MRVRWQLQSRYIQSCSRLFLCVPLIAASVRRRNGLALLGANDFLHALLPFGELLLRFVLGDAIGFLDLAREAVAFARNHLELVVAQLAPLLFGIALELLPVALDAVPVHLRFLCKRGKPARSKYRLPSVR